MKMKQLENLVSVEAVEDDSELVMKFPKPYCSFSPDEVLISLNNVSFHWPSETAGPEQGASLFERVDLCIRATSRIVILGKNGCGERSSSSSCCCVDSHHHRHCMYLESQS